MVWWNKDKDGIHRSYYSGGHGTLACQGPTQTVLSHLGPLHSQCWLLPQTSEIVQSLFCFSTSHPQSQIQWYGVWQCNHDHWFNLPTFLLSSTWAVQSSLLYWRGLEHEQSTGVKQWLGDCLSPVFVTCDIHGSCILCDLKFQDKINFVQNNDWS